MKKEKGRKFIKISALVFSIMALFIILGGVFYYISVTKDVKIDSFTPNMEIATTTILDSDLNEINYPSNMRVIASYNDISPNIINAFVAFEDKRFFKHNGIDWRRVIKAGYNNVKAGYSKEGGSTITQQLVKNAMLSNEKTVERKLKEMKLARQLEKRYSKEEIITFYLNTIYFGSGIYGISSACEKIFDKKPSEITVAEGAMLAAIVKNPLKNSPLNDMENSINRRNIVLKVMLNEEYITNKEYERSIQESYEKPIKTHKNPYLSYSSSVINEASRILGIDEKEVVSNDLVIETYFNRELQEIIFNGVESSLKIDGVDYSVMLADNVSGGITNYVSNLIYSPYEFHRQPASTIKPIVSYTPALNANLILPSCPILDEMCDFQGYSPKNYKNKYVGWTDIRNAVKNSSNVASVKVLQEVGVDYGKEVAQKMGLKLNDNDGLPVALGGLTDGVTPIELTTSYMTLANYGKRKNIGFIKKITDNKGKILYSHSDYGEQVVSEESAYLMTDMLISTAKSGTAKKLASLPFQVASKTGTTGIEGSNMNSDAWNMSYTTQNTLCVWYGNADMKHPMQENVTGGSYPTLCAKFVLENLNSPIDFHKPKSVNFVDIDEFMLKNYNKLQRASETTPKEYVRLILATNKYKMEYSTFFDGAVPNDLSVTTDNGEIRISFTSRTPFLYKIKRLDGCVDVTYEAQDVVNYIDYEPKFGMNEYYVSVFTKDGVLVGETEKVGVFNFDPSLWFRFPILR